MFINFVSSPYEGSFDRHYSLYDTKGGKRLADITTATGHCCAMNMISNFSYLNEEEWKLIKKFLSNENAFRHKGYGGSLEGETSSWKTKTFFLTIPEASANYNPPLYSILRKDPDIKLVHSFTNHAHDGHEVGLYKLEFV